MERTLPHLGVIGWPLSATLSPPMQNRALEQVGLPWIYEALRVEPDSLPDFLSAASMQMRGLNVTIPHKAAVVDSCTHLHGIAGVCRAVNTLVFRDGGRAIHGYNTDGPGLLKALAHVTGLNPKGSSVLIVGAGGSAAGCCASLAAVGVRKITIVNRTLGHALDIVSRLSLPYAGCAWTAIAADQIPLKSNREDAVNCAGADIIINCVPGEHSGSFIPVLSRGNPGCTFVDFAYGDADSAFLVEAARRGMRVIPGFEVLLWQGAIAFSLFTGMKAPVSDMREGLVEAAGRRWLQC